MCKTQSTKYVDNTVNNIVDDIVDETFFACDLCRCLLKSRASIPLKQIHTCMRPARRLVDQEADFIVVPLPATILAGLAERIAAVLTLHHSLNGAREFGTTSSTTFPRSRQIRTSPRTPRPCSWATHTTDLVPVAIMDGGTTNSRTTVVASSTMDGGTRLSTDRS